MTSVFSPDFDDVGLLSNSTLSLLWKTVFTLQKHMLHILALTLQLFWLVFSKLAQKFQVHILFEIFIKHSCDKLFKHYFISGTTALHSLDLSRQVFYCAEFKYIPTAVTIDHSVSQFTVLPSLLFNYETLYIFLLIWERCFTLIQNYE
jgi:hypothetical protein